MIKTKNHGASELLAMSGTSGKVRVGVIGDKASQTYEEGDTVLDVATKNEFGLGVPERSFIRAFVDENGPDIQKDIRKLTEMALEGKMSLEQALNLLGLQMVGGIQERISRGIPPKNSQITIDLKGSSTPLIGITGQLRSSIDHEAKLDG